MDDNGVWLPQGEALPWFHEAGKKDAIPKLHLKATQIRFLICKICDGEICILDDSL